MGCIKGISKFLLITVNLIFLLASLLMLALGITLVVAPQKIISFAESSGVNLQVISDATGGFFTQIINASGVFMIVLGSIVAIISFLGFVGACCDNSCMLGTYAVLLIVIVLAEIALIIFAAVYPQVFEQKSSDVMYTTLTKSFKTDIQLLPNGSFSNATLQPVDVAWMVLQFEVKCCGANNYTDYNQFSWTRCGNTGPCNSGNTIPISCCQLKNGTTFPSSQNDFVNVNTCLNGASSASTYLQGCANQTFTLAQTSIMRYSKIAIGIAAGIVGVEVILITLAFIICCRSKGSKSI